MNAAQLLELIAHGESVHVEFKSSFQKEVIETLTAFANTQGGAVLLGINDSGQVLGVSLQTETVQGWINQCKQVTSPRIIPDVELIQVDGKTVAAISIGEYPIKPVACKGRYYKRAGNANHQMTATEISDAHIKLINSSWDYPMDALREIIINMIVHRDYRSANDSTIKVFDDRIEFFNPGTLLDDLTVEKIKTGNYKSHLRNKQIATIFRELELIEKYGSGVRRVIDAFVAHGLPEPEFEATQGGMAVTVFKSHAQKTDVGVNEGVNEGVNPLFAHIAHSPGLRTPALAKTLNTSVKNVERWLKQLKAQGLVEFRGAPKTGGYHATASGSAATQQDSTP